MSYSDYQSLVDVILHDSYDKARGVTFIDGETDEKFVSYQDIYTSSLGILHHLQDRGLDVGQELVFQIEDNENFVYLFWACVLGGIIPVPVSIGNNDELRLKVFNIWDVLNKPHLIADRKTLSNLKKMEGIEGLKLKLEEIEKETILLEEIKDLKTPGRIYQARPSEIAFIQFSSGSTGIPKGVILTHENLLANLKAMTEHTNADMRDSFLSWVPLTHDLGMILYHLWPFTLGVNLYLMPTSLFVRHPTLWLKKANEHKASILCSPNFGINYFLTFFKPEIARNWDLSGIRFIINAAEPISAGLCNKFIKEMEPYGFRRIAMRPGYGMAEASVAVSLMPEKEEFAALNLDRRFLNIGDRIRELADSAANSTPFVEVGRPIPDCFVRIVDMENKILADDFVGYIQISGKNVTQGYYNNPHETKKLFSEDGWLNTGDVGFTRNGRLVITGRAKDIIIINGQNYYPSDLERVAEDIEEIELGKVAAVGISGAETETEELYLFVVTKKSVDKFYPLVSRLKRHIYEKVGIQVAKIIPLKKMPKTTSGKIQRYKLKEMYETCQFDSVLQEIDKLADNEAASTRDIYRNVEIENRLIRIFEEISGFKGIGRDDNLIEYVENSFLLTRMQGELEKYYPGKIRIVDFFSHPTVTDLVKMISDSMDFILQPIAFPSEFFTKPNNQNQNKCTFSFLITDQLLKNLKSISDMDDTRMDEILLALYLFLIGEVTGKQLIDVNVTVGNDFFRCFNMNLEKISDFSALFKAVAGKLRGKEINHLIREVDNTNYHPVSGFILPLYCQSEFTNRKTDLLHFFDIVLSPKILNNGIEMECFYNGTRLDHESVKGFFNKYITMVTMFVEKYIAANHEAAM